MNGSIRKLYTPSHSHVFFFLLYKKKILHFPPNAHFLNNILISIDSQIP